MTHDAVVTSRHYYQPVRAKLRRIESLVMSTQYGYGFVAITRLSVFGEVPHTCRPVKASRQNIFTIGAECYAGDLLCLDIPLEQFSTHWDAPHPHLSVLTGRRDQTAVRIEGRSVNVAPVIRKRFNAPPRVEIPDSDSFILTCGESQYVVCV